MQKFNQEHYRNQVADLILKDDDNNDLVIASTLHKHDDGSMGFEVRQDCEDGDRYYVTIKIEEI